MLHLETTPQQEAPVDVLRNLPDSEEWVIHPDGEVRPRLSQADTVLAAQVPAILG
jgi:hypothetical protein